MIKTYDVTCQVNMCSDREITVRVKANLERNAISKVEKKLRKKGYFAVKPIRCSKITEDATDGSTEQGI